MTAPTLTDELAEALEGLLESVAIGPLDAAAKYGPDFDWHGFTLEKAHIALAAIRKYRAAKAEDTP